MSLEHNLTLATQAVAHTLDVLYKGAANRISDLILSFGLSTFDVLEMRDDKSYDGTPYIWKDAARAIKHGCGNCGEHAAVAFMFLHAQKIRPIDFMALPKPRDHNFVIIGRASNSDPKDYLTWGDEAVVCDPWDKKAFIAKEIPAKLHGGLISGFELQGRIE